MIEASIRIAGHGQAEGIVQAIAAKDRPQSKMFETLARELLQQGNEIRFQARGASMSPAIRDGEIVLVKPALLAQLRPGDIVLAKGEMGFRLHRLVVADVEQDVFITRGDCGQQNDPAIGGEAILGEAVGKEVRVGNRLVLAKFRGIGGQLLRAAARGQAIMSKILAIEREVATSEAGGRRCCGTMMARSAARTSCAEIRKRNSRVPRRFRRFQGCRW